MTVENLKTLFEKSKHYSSENSGKVMMCSDRGPAGFDLIEALIQVVESQQREIEAIKAKFIS